MDFENYDKFRKCIDKMIEMMEDFDKFPEHEQKQIVDNWNFYS